MIWKDKGTNFFSLFRCIDEFLAFVCFLLRSHIIKVLLAGRNTIPLMDGIDKRRAPTNALIIRLPWNGILRLDLNYEKR